MNKVLCVRCTSVSLSLSLSLSISLSLSLPRSVSLCLLSLSSLSLSLSLLHTHTPLPLIHICMYVHIYIYIYIYKPLSDKTSEILFYICICGLVSAVSDSTISLIHVWLQTLADNLSDILAAWLVLSPIPKPLTHYPSLNPYSHPLPPPPAPPHFFFHFFIPSPALELAGTPVASLGEHYKSIFEALRHILWPCSAYISRRTVISRALPKVYCSILSLSLFLSLSIYIYLHTYVYIYTHKHTHIHTYTHAHIYVYTHICIYTHTYVVYNMYAHI